MREIKFRVFDKGIGMVEFDFNKVNFGKVSVCSYDHDLNKSEVMQFTGMKDKNGKEIYEGDIVKTGNDGIMLVGFGNYPYLLGMYNYGYYYLKNKEEYFTLTINTCQDCEVIGDIYENRELLKEKK